MSEWVWRKTLRRREETWKRPRHLPLESLQRHCCLDGNIWKPERWEKGSPVTHLQGPETASDLSAFR